VQISARYSASPVLEDPTPYSTSKPFIISPSFSSCPSGQLYESKCSFAGGVSLIVTVKFWAGMLLSEQRVSTVLELNGVNGSIPESIAALTLLGKLWK
jgi:hypothetical protein